MQSFAVLVRTYCGTCLLAGVLQQFFVSDRGRTCLRAVTGLYLAVSLLGCLHSLPPLPRPGRTAAQAAEQTSQLYTDQMLDRTRQQLEQACGQILQAEGIGAQASVALTVTPQGDVRVAEIILTGPPDPRAETLLHIFAADRIRWQTGEDHA